MMEYNKSFIILGNDRRFNEVNFGSLEGRPADDCFIVEIQQNPGNTK